VSESGKKGKNMVKMKVFSIIEKVSMNLLIKGEFFSAETGENLTAIDKMIMALNIFQFVSNFKDIKNGQTPMMRERLFKKSWTEDDFLNYHFQL